MTPTRSTKSTTSSVWVSDEYHNSMKVNTGRSLYNEYMSTMKVDRALVSKQIQMEGDIMNLLLESKSPKLADATPLGLCGFAGTTFILSMMNAGVIVDLRASSMGVVLGMALAFGGVAQFVAGLLVFQVGNMLAGTLFCSYGAFWVSYAALFVDAFGFLDGYTGSGSERDLNNGLGIYLLSWAIFTLCMAVAALRTNVVLLSILVILFFAFMCLSISHFVDNDLEWRRAGGLLGIIISLLAWYKAVAVFLTKDNSFFTLPIGHLDTIYQKWGWLPKPEDLSKKNDDTTMDEAKDDDNTREVGVVENAPGRNV